MMFDHLFQTESFRSAVCNCQHIYTEGIFQFGLLIEHVCKVLYICITFQIQNNPDSLFGRLVGNIYDICCLLVFHKRCNIIQEFSNIGTDHGIWDFRNHKLLSASFELHGLHFTSDTEFTGSCLINLEQIIFIYYQAACGEVRSFQIAHQTFNTDVVILHICFYRIYHFTQIVRRNAGCHTDCDTICSIYQQIGDSDRKYHRFLLCLVEVRHKVYILIQVFEKDILCQFLQSGLCISHSSCTVTLDGTEVSMSVHQCSAFLEILRHYYKCFIDRTVTVRVIFTHGIPYDTGTFPVWSVIADTQFIHIIQGSPLYRLQSVTHIRKGSGDNNAHGIIDIGFLHDLRIVGRDYILLFCFHFFHSSIQLHIRCPVLHPVHAHR